MQIFVKISPIFFGILQNHVSDFDRTHRSDAKIAHSRRLSHIGSSGGSRAAMRGLAALIAVRASDPAECTDLAGQRIAHRNADSGKYLTFSYAHVWPCKFLYEREAGGWFRPQLKGSISNLSLIFQPNEQTLQGSLSSVSTPNFATKYSLESS